MRDKEYMDINDNSPRSVIPAPAFVRVNSSGNPEFLDYPVKLDNDRKSDSFIEEQV